jgi:hypothetical protein
VQPCRLRGQQTGDLPHLPPFIRHAPTGTEHRHPHYSVTAQQQRCENTMVYTHVLYRGPSGVRSPAVLL